MILSLEILKINIDSVGQTYTLHARQGNHSVQGSSVKVVTDQGEGFKATVVTTKINDKLVPTIALFPLNESQTLPPWWSFRYMNNPEPTKGVKVIVDTSVDKKVFLRT